MARNEKQLPRRLADTKVFLAGINHTDLGNPKVIDWLKSNKVSQVFCLFPLTQHQFDGLPKDAVSGDLDMMEMYSRRGIDPNFSGKLHEKGIRASSLMRSPVRGKELRGYDSFVKEARGVKGNFLIVCWGGWHASGAYALYYLATSTPLSMAQIHEKFLKTGYAKEDINLSKNFIKRVGIDVDKVVEKKLRLQEIVSLALKKHEKKKKVSKENPKLRRPRRS